MHQFTCHHLSEKMDFFDEVVQTSFEEWGHLAPEWTHADWAADIADSVPSQGVEQTLIALDNRGAFAGMVRLSATDMDTRKNIYGWVTNVYVKPQHRGLGLGTWLVARMEAQAVSIGLMEVHLYTVDAEDFYKRTGWEAVERTTYKGEQVTVMRKDLAAVMELHHQVADNVVPFPQKDS